MCLLKPLIYIYIIILIWVLLNVFDFPLLGFWAAFLHRNDKGETIIGSYFHTVSPLTNTVVGAELTHSFATNENMLTIGTQHALDPLTSVKARVNNYGKASALIQHEWRPKSLVTISGEVDTRAVEKSAKIGLAVALKPWSMKPTIPTHNGIFFSFSRNRASNKVDSCMKFWAGNVATFSCMDMVLCCKNNSYWDLESSLGESAGVIWRLEMMI